MAADPFQYVEERIHRPSAAPNRKLRDRWLLRAVSFSGHRDPQLRVDVETPRHRSTRVEGLFDEVAPLAVLLWRAAIAVMAASFVKISLRHRSTKARESPRDLATVAPCTL